jgi:histidinol-phosphate aminotransferase
MAISRRTLLQRLSMGAAATVARPWLAELSAAGPSGRPIRLNRNENAYGPSEQAMAAMRQVTSANRYADVETEALRRKIADCHGVTSEQVVLGCGSGEVLRMALDAFVGSRKTLIVAVPTFDAIGDAARRVGAEVVAVPLKKDYSHDLEAMLARSDAATGLIYICNPNNPTGTLTHRRDLEAFIRRLPAMTSVVIDEAYHHYVGESSDYASFIDRPMDDGRIIVTRSFSKIYGLAGLRIGYAIAAPQTSGLLAAHRLLDDVNVVAAMAAVAALDDVEHVRVSASRNTDARQEFFNQANARMLRWIDSQTNFVMLHGAHPAVARPAVEVIEHFKEHEILVGPPIPSFEKSIRVSLGTAAEMREFWRTWDLMPHQMSM